MTLHSHIAQMMAGIKIAIHMTGTDLKFILPGHTSKLQTMDVGLNKSFKDRLQHEAE